MYLGFYADLVYVLGFFNIDTFRAILSFDTSSLSGSPSKAVLRVHRSSLSGTINSISIDVKQGFFGSSSAVELVLFLRLLMIIIINS